MRVMRSGAMICYFYAADMPPMRAYRCFDAIVLLCPARLLRLKLYNHHFGHAYAATLPL